MSSINISKLNLSVSNIPQKKDLIGCNSVSFKENNPNEISTTRKEHGVGDKIALVAAFIIGPFLGLDLILPYFNKKRNKLNDISNNLVPKIDDFIAISEDCKQIGEESSKVAKNLLSKLG